MLDIEDTGWELKVAGKGKPLQERSNKRESEEHCDKQERSGQGLFHARTIGETYVFFNLNLDGLVMSRLRDTAFLPSPSNLTSLQGLPALKILDQ